MISKYILHTMKEFDGCDEERMLFDEIRPVDFTARGREKSSIPISAIITRILEQVEMK